MLGLTLWQVSAPTDPSNVNNVLAWALTLCVAAIGWMEIANRRENAARHADKDKQLTRKDELNDALVAAGKEYQAAIVAQTAAVQALSTAVQAQAAALTQLQQDVRELKDARKARQ